MKTVYRLGQLFNVFLVGMLCGITLYSTIRHAEAFEAERAAAHVNGGGGDGGIRDLLHRPAPRPLSRGIDAEYACGWIAPDQAREMGWK